MPLNKLLIISVTFFQLFFSAFSFAADDLDHQSLSRILKKTNFKANYAKNRLHFGTVQKEPYMTEDNSLKIKKSFLKAIHGHTYKYWKKYFLKNKAFNGISLLNKGLPYKQIVQNIFIYHNLPKELYYVGLIESRYEFRIKSHAGARGPWQFLASTGRKYGLIINRYYDERTNLIKSTHAAAKYFKDLYTVFGSWELALSAYNAGEYGVIRKIKKAGSKNFYTLSRKKLLPKETRNYIPKVLALMHIDKNPRKYKLKLKKASTSLGRYENTYLVKLNKQYKLKKIATHIGISMAAIRKLNPELRGYYTPQVKNGKTYQLRLPRPKNERVIASIPVKSLKTKKRKLPTFHTIKAGENLSLVANKYSIPLAALLLVNHGLEKKTLHPGDRVRLKAKAVKKKKSIKIVQKKSQKKRKSPSKFITQKVFYVIKPGDSLSSISRMFNIKIADIKAVNNLFSHRIKLGDTLLIPGIEKSIHVVKKGEKLKRIAKKYRNSLKAIKNLNNLKTLKLKVGQRIVVLN